MEIIKETNFIRFVRLDRPKKHKTDIVQILNSNDELLGEIKWYANWRKYCFFPSSDVLFDAICLENILDVVFQLQTERNIIDL